MIDFSFYSNIFVFNRNFEAFSKVIDGLIFCQLLCNIITISISACLVHIVSDITQLRLFPDLTFFFRPGISSSQFRNSELHIHRFYISCRNVSLLSFRHAIETPVDAKLPTRL